MHDDQLNKKIEPDSKLGQTPGSWPNPLEQVSQVTRHIVQMLVPAMR
jgi:hypothetical protein